MKGHQQLNNETVEVEQVALGNGNTMGVSQEGGFSCNKVTDNLNSVEVDASTTMAVVKAKKPVGGLPPKVASATPVSHIQNEFSPENSQSCEKHHQPGNISANRANNPVVSNCLRRRIVNIPS
jgi:hypothetical protein